MPCWPLVDLAPLALGAAEGAASEPSQLFRFAARFHSVLLHLPIGFIALAFLLELASLFRRNPERARLVRFTLILSSVSAAVVAALGLMLSTEGGYDAQTLRWHQWLGFGVVALAFAATAAHVAAHRQGSRWRAKLSYAGLLVALVGLLVATGHHGGNLTHGSQYLVKYAPDFVRSFVAAAEPGPSPAASPQDAEARRFRELVEPLLQKKCVPCHGPEKQKGEYRLDTRAAALAGGESGEAAIVPGEPMKSVLLHRILLPSEHDDVMPPKGKAALSTEEVVVLAHWIQAGASFGEEGEAASSPALDAEPRPPAAPDLEPGDASPSPETLDFARDIQPILVERCVKCHGPEKRKGRLELHTREGLRRGGKKHGAAVVDGKPDGSPLYQRIAIAPGSDGEDDIMPPADEGGRLTERDIALFGRWIELGAPWPEGIVLAPSAAREPEESRKEPPP
jgi:uncharacterized membrane protein